MTQEELEMVIEESEELMNQSTEHLSQELVKVRTGKASTTMLNGVKVDYYGSLTPLNQVANVSVSDSKTLAIQPWEKSIIGDIEKAIFEANLGLTPRNDGDMIHINIPPLTEERRKDLVKYTKTLGEDARVSIRNARQKAMSAIKQAVKDGYPEDVAKRDEASVEEKSTSFNKKVEAILQAKEKDIMTV